MRDFLAPSLLIFCSVSFTYLEPDLVSPIFIHGTQGAIHDGWASISEFEKTLKPDFLYHYLSSQSVQSTN
jgi:hypothetical protein